LQTPARELCRQHGLPCGELRAATDERLIVYPKSPRPSYADQVLSFYRDAGIEPIVATEAKELQTALGLVASGGVVCIVPASVKRLGRDDVRFIDLDEPKMVSPIIMSHRKHVRFAPAVSQAGSRVRRVGCVRRLAGSLPLWASFDRRDPEHYVSLCEAR
jgi:DNA-binding transcriptional LysR family regulator